MSGAAASPELFVVAFCFEPLGKTLLSVLFDEVARELLGCWLSVLGSSARLFFSPQSKSACLEFASDEASRELLGA